MREKLKSNIWKYFLIILTNRRNYIPILAIYFLTLPDTAAKQIGLFTGIGWFAGFLMETPSGYLADVWGHKKALLLAKFSMLISTLFFIFGDSLLEFALGSSFVAFGFAFTSGTSGAFLHNTLVGLKREEEYGALDGKIKANVSLISAAMIFLLPFLTNISLLLPIQAYLFFDIIGILTAFSLFSPTIKYGAKDLEGEKIWSQLKRFKGTGFYLASLFVGVIGAFTIGISPFKEPFVKELGLPIVLIGSIMALSRVIWFIVGNNLIILKKINLRRLLFYEIFFFSGLLMLSSQLKNPYFVGSIFAVIIGYYHGRDTLIDEYYLKHFLNNKRYKATMLSIKHQIEKALQAGFTVIIGFTMGISFSTGFLVSGICLLVLLLGIFPFLKKQIK